MIQILGLLLTIFILFLLVGAIVLYQNELVHRDHMEEMSKKRILKNQEAEAKAAVRHEKELVAWGTSVDEFGEDGVYFQNMTEFIEKDPEFELIFGNNKYLMAQRRDMNDQRNNQCGAGSISADSDTFFDDLYGLGEELTPAETTIVDPIISPPLFQIPAFIPKDDEAHLETDPLFKDLTEVAESDTDRDVSVSNKLAQLIVKRGENGRIKEIVDGPHDHAEENAGDRG